MTGAHTYAEANGSVSLNTTIDLVLNNTNNPGIVCTAAVDQGATSVFLNTCNDGGGAGGSANVGLQQNVSLFCDGVDGATGPFTNASNAPLTCTGGFLLTNMGVSGELNATLVSLSNADNLYSYLYNATTDGCACQQVIASTAEASREITASTRRLCGNLTTRGAVCQCVGIKVTNNVKVAALKAGTPISFIKNDTLSAPASC